MQCKYIYREGDEAVLDGRCKVGDTCGSQYGAAKWGGLCAPHARAMGVMTEPEMEHEKKRRMESKQEIKERKAEAAQKADETMSGVGDAANSPINNRVLEALNFKDQCDLAEEYALFRAMPGRRTFVDYDEKVAFARWLEAPAHLRVPQTIEDAAKVLGRSPKTLISWKTAPEVIDFINADMEMRLLGLFPLAIYKWGVNIDRGDIRSITEFKAYYEEKQQQRNKSKKSLDIPHDLIKEANDYARSQGEQNRGAALTAEKNMVIQSHFNKPVEDDEIKQ